MMKKLLALLLFAAPLAAQQINSATQIKWPPVTGTGAPLGVCTSSNYGQPYTNTTNGDFYVCTSLGYIKISGTNTPPGGAATDVQFNDGGVFGGNSFFTYDKTTGNVTGNDFIAGSNSAGVAGEFDLGSGTAPSTTPVASTHQWFAPVSVTGWQETDVSAAPPDATHIYKTCTFVDATHCTDAWAAVSGGSFSSLTGGTNTTAAMVVGSGASLAPTGTGTIQATDIAGTVRAGTNVTITGSGTTGAPYVIAASGGSGTYPAPVTLTASSSAELDFTTCLSGTYNDYEIRYRDIVRSSATAELLVQVSTNGGSTWDSTSGHYSWARAYAGVVAGNSTGFTAQQSDTGFTLTGGPTASADIANSPLSGRMTLFGVNSTNYKNFQGTQMLNSTGVTYGEDVWEQYIVATAINAVRVIPSTGTITSGTVTCQPLPQ